MSSRLSQQIRDNLRLALPIILGQVGLMAMGLIDTAFVGRVSEKDLAAVALGNTLVFGFSMPGVGLLMAIEPLVAQALGSNDLKKAHATYRSGIWLAFAATVPTAAITWLSLPILPLLKVDPTILPDVSKYVLARLPGTLPFFLFLVGKTYQQAALRPRVALEAVIVGNLFHALSCWITVFGKFGFPPMGGMGAGIATAISTLVMALWVLVIRGKVPSLTTSQPPPHPTVDSTIHSTSDSPQDDDAHLLDSRSLATRTRRELLKLGIPIGLTLSAEVGVFSVVAMLMGRIGKRAAAAHQIAIGLASLSFMGALGIAQATSVRVGHEIGGGDRHAAQQAGFVGIGLGMGIMSLSAVAFGLFPTALARVFTPDAPVIAAAAELITVAAVFQLGDGAQAVAAGALRGAGDTRWPLFLNVVVHWLVGLPLALFFGFQRGLGAVGLWYGLTAGLILIAVALTARFRLLMRTS